MATLGTTGPWGKRHDCLRLRGSEGRSGSCISRRSHVLGRGEPLSCGGRSDPPCGCQQWLCAGPNALGCEGMCGLWCRAKCAKGPRRPSRELRPGALLAWEPLPELWGSAAGEWAQHLRAGHLGRGQPSAAMGFWDLWGGKQEVLLLEQLLTGSSTQGGSPGSHGPQMQQD